jgi:oxygen-independent coproporphyrinogen III oxidase
MNVNLDLARRYDVAGPRYTSYPTAPQFHAWEPGEWLDILRDNERTSVRDLSLYFHLPFCETLCYYCGCNVIITHDRTRIAQYLGYLDREMTLFDEQVGTRRRVTQVHWGGGSPSNLTPDEIRTLGAMIRSHFDVAPDAEIGVEIDPRRLTREHVEAFAEMGFNRASLGVQDFDPQVQLAINRWQPEEETVRAIEWCRELGLTSINVDLIYGLPHQTKESFHRTLERVIELAPDRLAVFNFAFVPWIKPHQKIIDQSALPTADTKLEMLKDIVETLTAAGYVYVGMDHFAKPTDTMAVAQREHRLHRNFQGYSTHADCDLLAFGMTSIGSNQRAYSQNVKKIGEYYGAIDRGELPAAVGIRLTDDDVLRRDVIMTLMCDMELDRDRVERAYEIEFEEYFEGIDQKLASFVADGLVEVEGRVIRVTDEGRLFLRNIAMQFDAYLGVGVRGYSRTV